MSDDRQIRHPGTAPIGMPERRMDLSNLLGSAPSSSKRSGLFLTRISNPIADESVS